MPIKVISEKVILIALALVSLGILTAKVSSRRSETPEQRSNQRDQLVHPRQPRLAQNYGKLPLRFELNQGQTDSQVKFLSRGSGYTMFLTGNEAVLALNKPSAAVGRRPIRRRLPVASSPLGQSVEHGSPVTDPFLPSLIQNPKSQIENPPAPSPEFLAPAVFRMRLVGANPKAKVVGLDELPGKSNYFPGNDPKKWCTNVSNYAKVKYEDIYPGIDLVYYGNEGKLEHDFVVAPGANPGAIRLAIDGAEGISVDEGGNVVARLDGGSVVLNNPTIYQNAAVHPKSKTENPKSIAGRIVLLASNQIGFEVANYNVKLPLIIDPVLTYSTYLGGSADEMASGIAVDSSGNAYVTGRTTSIDFPTVNPLQASAGGGTCGGTAPNLIPCPDVFVVKLNPAGSAPVYSTYLGGASGDVSYGIAVDSSGNAYVTGATGSTDFPTVNPLEATYHSAFVAKLNTPGSALVYSTYLGGTARGIAVDSSGNVYVTGYTDSDDIPAVNPVQATRHAL